MHGCYFNLIGISSPQTDHLKSQTGKKVMSTSLQENLKHKKKSSFFSEISPYLEYASIFDHELNRRVAHKFNVFDFLDKKEIGLSKIIAHLFNPSASHGQGTIFLRHFLKLVTNEENNWNHLDSDIVKVDTEHTTDEGRRIDIYVEILGENPFVLAIENKPRPRDRENQVLDYLEYLDEPTRDYLLVYLSAGGEGPSERSFPQNKRCKWTEKFTVMSYVESGVDLDESRDTEEENQEVKSLATWLKICKEKCEVDRLRWFLGDAENFCTKNFGDSNSTDDVEVKIVEKFLLEKDNHKYLKTAYAVNKAWPNVMCQVRKLYFETLIEAIKKKIEDKYSKKRKDIQIPPPSFSKEITLVYLYSNNWFKCADPDTKFDAEGRYSIILTHDEKYGRFGWYVGIRSPKNKNDMNEGVEKDSFESIKKKLKKLKNISGLEDDDSFPGYIYAAEKEQYWEKYLGQDLEILLNESEKMGRISNYFVDFFWDFANEAIDILDKIEQHP